MRRFWDGAQTTSLEPVLKSIWQIQQQIVADRRTGMLTYFSYGKRSACGPREKGLQSGKGLASLADGHGQKRAIARSRKRDAAQAGAGRQRISQVSTDLVLFLSKPEQNIVD